MWNHDAYWSKAQTYFARGGEHEHSDDEEFTLWHLLGLEFLICAPLAKIHPSLLAALDHENILAANGFASPNKEPKTIPISVSVARLGQLYSGFTTELAKDALQLISLRNAELHSDAAAIASVANELWLPKLIRVCEALCEILGESIEDLLDPEVIALGTSLVDEEDKKLQHEVQVKIQASKEFFDRLTAEERRMRLASASDILTTFFVARMATCPACGNPSAPIAEKELRTTGDRLDDDSLVRDIVTVAQGLKCSVCSLSLESTAEIVAAGLPQQYTREVREELAERYMPEHGYDADYEEYLANMGGEYGDE